MILLKRQFESAGGTPLGHAAHLGAAHLLHQLLHQLELFQQTVDILHLEAAAGGNALLAAEVDDVGVLAILVGIEVIDEQDVGAYGLITGTTRRLPGTDGAERCTSFGYELVGGPIAKRLLLAIIGNYALVCFEVYTIRIQQANGIVLAVGGDYYVLLSAC